MLRLRDDLFRAAVRRAAGDRAVAFGTGDAGFRDWLARRRLPAELVRFLIENALSFDVCSDDVGAIYDPEGVMAINDQEETRCLAYSGLFGVGNAINGDWIVIDVIEGEGQAGFVDHDALADKGPEDDARDAFMPAARSIGEMIHGLTAIDDFPHDYWAARDYPVVFDADAVRTPVGPCLGNTVRRVESIVYYHQGHLVDRPDMEERLRLEGYELADLVDDPGRWTNDMRTVVYSFRRDNVAGGLATLDFARKLLAAHPTEFEFFDARGWIYARIYWEDGWTASEPDEADPDIHRFFGGLS